jgi:hypothetical protein
MRPYRRSTTVAGSERQSQTGTRSCVLLSAITALIVAGFGWDIVSTTALTRVPPSEPSAVLRVKNVDILVSEGVELLSDTPSAGDFDLAERLATTALQRTPLASKAIRILGLVASFRGDEPRAFSLLLTATKRWVYDTEAQIWVANYYLRGGKVRNALHHLDLLLRARPSTAEFVFPSLIVLANDPANLKAFTDALAGVPPWRANFLTQFSLEADVTMPADLMAALRTRSSPPTAEELRPYLQRLLAEQLVSEAYRLWEASLPPGRPS